MEQTNTTNSYTYSYGCCSHKLPCGRCDVTGKMCYETYNSYTIRPDWWKDYITTTTADAHTYLNSEFINTDEKTSVDPNSDALKGLRC